MPQNYRPDKPSPFVRLPSALDIILPRFFLRCALCFIMLFLKFPQCMLPLYLPTHAHTLSIRKVCYIVIVKLSSCDCPDLQPLHSSICCPGLIHEPHTTGDLLAICFFRQLKLGTFVIFPYIVSIIEYFTSLIWAYLIGVQFRRRLLNDDDVSTKTRKVSSSESTAPTHVRASIF